MLSCRDVTRLLASDELRRSAWRKRLAVRLHLLMCDHCSRYLRELRLIGAAVRLQFQRVVPGRGELDRLEHAIRQLLRDENRR